MYKRPETAEGESTKCGIVSDGWFLKTCEVEACCGWVQDTPSTGHIARLSLGCNARTLVQCRLQRKVFVKLGTPPPLLERLKVRAWNGKFWCWFIWSRDC